MDRAGISAVLIVRDEVALLGDCLASIGGVVDQVVVVDTGSTDGTPEVAEAAGAEVAHRPWDGDFSAARNWALDLAREPWILSIDADERVTAFDPDLVARALSDERAVGGLVRMRPAAAMTRYRELRVFRNRPDIRYVGRFHEDVVIATRAVAGAEAGTIYDLAIDLDHLGYDGDMTAKQERDHALLLAHLAERPDHAHSWRHLGVVLAAAGRVEEAEAAWTRAIEIGEHDPDQDRWLPWGDLIVSRMARGEAVDDLLRRAASRYGDVAPVRTLRADVAMGRGDWAAAATDLTSLLDDGVPELADVAIDRRTWAEHSWMRLGVCRFQLGDAAGAAEAFRRVVALDPTPEARARLAVAEAAARRAGHEGRTT